MNGIEKTNTVFDKVGFFLVMRNFNYLCIKINII